MNCLFTLIQTWFRRARGLGLWAVLLPAVLATATAPPVTNAPGSFLVPNDTPERLTLAEAKRLAFLRNWDLLASQSDVDIALAQKVVTKEFPNPSLAWSTAKVPLNDQPAHTAQGNGLWQRNYDTIMSVNQLFEIGGKRRSRQVSADHGIIASKARLADARRLLGGLTAQTLRESAASLSREADIAAVRLKAGDISTADKSRIEIDAGRFDLDAKAAEAGALQQRIALENLIGTLRPSGKWLAVDSMEDLIGTPLADGETRSLPMRPDLVAAEASLKKAEADLRLQKAMRYPDPTVMVMYEHNPPVPLPLWNRNKGAIQAAEAARAQAATQLDKVKGQIAAEIVSAREACREAASRYDNYLRVLKPKSAEILKTISFAYEKGGASLLDLLSAQRNDNDVRLATVQAAADAASAQAALKAALAGADETASTKGPDLK
ncbi:MAG: TolC family protein [Verrucomicrobia bacterium]|nr:TolC family protein [Verrucomicrobiota bacterium]